MDKHYLTPLFNPASVVVFAGKVDDPTTQTPQAVALLEALHAQRFTGTLHYLDIHTSVPLVWMSR